MSLDSSPVLKRLAVAESIGRLGHALLLVSPSSSDANFKKIVLQFSKDLLCTDTVDYRSCGHCLSCEAFKTNNDSTHLDFYHLRPEKLDAYVLEQTKGLRSFLSLKKAVGRIKIVFIEQAEALSAGGGAAANAILKMLEEPRDEVKLILTSSRPEGIMATIRSRCQTFRIPQSVTPLEDESLDSSLDEGWNDLFNWIESGARQENWPRLQLPADKDTFFKDRDFARENLKQVFLVAWDASRNKWADWDLHTARAMMSWFSDFERLLASLKAYGQSSLQWSSFKYRANNS